MTDEQIIYLGPEEELTTVRSRLEHAEARRIMLVIPPQTQIRSHVAWRLLRSRMRELGKEVLVISSDRQIRAVAKTAGFRVADSLESSPSGRSRPSSHPIRSDTGGKTAQRSRTQAGRGSADYRSTRQQQQPNQLQLATNDRQQMQQPRREAGSKTSRADETISAPDVDAASSTYEVHIDTSPSIRSLLPEHEDDELDPIEDFHFAQSIREAVRGAGAGIAPLPPGRDPSSVKPGQQTTMSPPDEMQDDPFAYMEDIQPAPLLERRDSTYIEDIDPGVPDILDISTDILATKIEGSDDNGGIVVRIDSSLLHEKASSTSTSNTSEQAKQQADQPSISMKVFYCYAREDKTLRDELEKHLGNLKRQSKITGWHDRDISAGTEWEKAIDTNLNAANIILLLISPDFIDSDYCYSIEMKRALERHHNGDARVIPVILRPVDWEDAPFSSLQVLPTDGKPVNSALWHNRDEAFSDIAKGIRKVVNELLASR